MAKFAVLKNFKVAADTETRHLQAGGVYMAGDEISGLSAAEASELLKLAPAGTFEARDEEAETIATYVLRLSGGVGVDSNLEVN